jgi:hypothetical protein
MTRDGWNAVQTSGILLDAVKRLARRKETYVLLQEKGTKLNNVAQVGGQEIRATRRAEG